MSSEKAERLWLTHVQSSLTHTSGQPRLFVFYEDIVNDWALELRRMAAFIGRPERGEDPRVHASVGEFLEKELCHHHVSMEDLAGSQRISFATKGLYLALRVHAPQETRVDDAFSRDRVDRSVQKTLDLLGAQALETWDRTVALVAERHQLAAECHEFAVKENRLLQSMAKLESDLRHVTIERDVKTREGEAALRMLQEIRASCGWRLVTFWRQLIVELLPSGTRRRRIFNAVLRRLAQSADVAFRAA